ncbi:MAG: hypothetical protein AVDCRST_MAG68-2015 [uncultured Gemmatimonadetes bacterium]|uniref:Uncharacterized protein n=1 Tax=uncultured Gemmatimonadota bacterium TaxID=203437 RepID=A0A6J4L771_9BACT|nr:MAG: hypothetical protein AVDCRST_MAG68-2015 [uncultured Gemmatimonadota bacterium]
MGAFRASQQSTRCSQARKERMLSDSWRTAISHRDTEAQKRLYLCASVSLCEPAVC